MSIVSMHGIMIDNLLWGVLQDIVCPSQLLKGKESIYTWQLVKYEGIVITKHS